jgi:hypothetical protein
VSPVRQRVAPQPWKPAHGRPPTCCFPPCSTWLPFHHRHFTYQRCRTAIVFTPAPSSLAFLTSRCGRRCCCSSRRRPRARARSCQERGRRLFPTPLRLLRPVAPPALQKARGRGPPAGLMTVPAGPPAFPVPTPALSLSPFAAPRYATGRTKRHGKCVNAFRQRGGGDHGARRGRSSAVKLGPGRLRRGAESRGLRAQPAARRGPPGPAARACCCVPGSRLGPAAAWSRGLSPAACRRRGRNTPRSASPCRPPCRRPT